MAEKKEYKVLLQDIIPDQIFLKSQLELIKEYPGIEKSGAGLRDMAYDIQIQDGFNIPSSIHQVTLVILMKIKYDKQEIHVASVGSTFLFKVDELKDFVEEDVVKLPRKYRVTNFSICLSTMRGILFEKLFPTYLNKIVFPIIPMSTVEAMAKDREIKDKERANQNN